MQFGGSVILPFFDYVKLYVRSAFVCYMLTEHIYVFQQAVSINWIVTAVCI